MLIVIKGMLCSDWTKNHIKEKAPEKKLISTFAFLILLHFYLSCKMDADWKSFIVSEIVSRTLCLAQTECGGCKDNNYCPLLHACQTTSLLRKFECFLHSRIKLGMHQDLESILNQFESRFILVDRREHYIESGKTLLNDLSPESLYYGRRFNLRPLLLTIHLATQGNSGTKILKYPFRRGFCKKSVKRSM